MELLGQKSDLNTGRYGLAGAGANNTSALIFGGISTVQHAETELYNGTSWSEQNDILMLEEL
jgi:hypothetical protein